MTNGPGPTIRPFVADDTERVVELWHACGLIRPWNDPRKDIERKLKVQPELFLVATATGDTSTDDVVGTAMAGYDGHRGWIYYLAVDPACQGRGYGRALLADVESRLVSLGCPKLNFQVRKDNGSVTGFYEVLGFAEDECLSFGKRLIPDAP
ncbi:GNAT family acetyltransferase [Nonomuraea sp. CA-141351]|uniref:GNAT family acetyltransferase n=1 Tax=Nonomuraea sp. CA-141351 TaxID=3239996 RepID=UPI003D8BE9E3